MNDLREKRFCRTCLFFNQLLRPLIGGQAHETAQAVTSQSAPAAAEYRSAIQLEVSLHECFAWPKTLTPVFLRCISASATTRPPSRRSALQTYKYKSLQLGKCISTSTHSQVPSTMSLAPLIPNDVYHIWNGEFVNYAADLSNGKIAAWEDRDGTSSRDKVRVVLC
ncbi:hypothetical protein OG21DRAFT_683126 [Imleria badia]|nr:hypothetical protein OG21DRAFT_683126 [Imleria badia]